MVHAINYKGWQIEITAIERGFSPSTFTIRCKSNRAKKWFRSVYKSITELVKNLWKIRKYISEKYKAEKALKAHKKAMRETIQNTFEVGQIYYTSWGYEQTNIDFYQVVKVLPKSAFLKHVRSNKTEDGFMTGYKTPIKESFIGDDILVRVTKYQSLHGHGLYKYDGKPKRYSSYA